jgi:hypothetical protein
MERPAVAWRPIGAVLVDSGSITEAQLQAALEEQKRSGRKLGEILIDSGVITWNALALAIAEQVQGLDGPEEEPAPAPEPQPEPEPAVAGAPSERPDARLQTVETMLRERQRAFLELVSTTETLRRTVAKLQDQLAEKDAEIARLRLQAIAS